MTMSILHLPVGWMDMVGCLVLVVGGALSVVCDNLACSQ